MKKSNFSLDGFGFSGYRSFQTYQQLGKLSKVNILIGRNNVGKSNIINFLSNHFINWVNPRATPPQALKFDNLRDKSFYKDSKLYQVSYAATPERVLESNDLVRQLSSINQRGAVGDLKSLLEFLASESNLMWFYFSTEESTPTNFYFEKEKLISRGVRSFLDHYRWQRLWTSLTGKMNGDIDAHWIPETLGFIAQSVRPNLDIKIIPAFRKIATSGVDDKNSVVFDEDYSGRGLVRRISQIKSPTFAERNRLREYDDLLVFFRKVLRNSTADISVPHDNSEVLVKLDGMLQPISSLGAGISQVLIMAAYCTVNSNCLICIEEPETNLHPTLQAEIADYLLNHTSNQYFLTTHSPSFVNIASASIFEVQMNEKNSQVQSIASASSRHNVLRNLGHQPSDLLQTNCVIWVEGPSDCMYLNSWIKKRAPNLINGVDFSLMFFGGINNIEHLISEDEDKEEFLNIFKINRRTALIMDSDKSTDEDDISDLKKSISSMVLDAGGFVWITQGRELENYFPSDTIENSGGQAADSRSFEFFNGPFAKTLAIKSKVSGKISNLGKVSTARRVITRGIPDGDLDWSEKLGELLQFIEQSNVRL